MIVNKLKAILGFILTLIKRSLCCFRRRRKSSADVVPLTDIGIVPNYQSPNNGPELTNWNSWDDPSQPRPPQTIEEHIEHYRHSRAAARLKQEEDEPQPNFFQDMEPTIKRQMKMVLRPKDSQVSSLLNYGQDDIIPNDSGELKSWEEVENREGDWADGTDKWTMNDALRQSRKEEKMRKHMEKELRRSGLS